MNKFKDYITKNHPEFKIEESILGILGRVALGAAAVGKTAIDRSRGRNNYGVTTSPTISSNTSNNISSKYLVNNFINQPWDWDKVVNDKIIEFLYSTDSKDDNEFKPVLKADLLSLGGTVSRRNKNTGNSSCSSKAKSQCSNY